MASGIAKQGSISSCEGLLILHSKNSCVCVCGGGGGGGGGRIAVTKEVIGGRGEEAGINITV